MRAVHDLGESVLNFVENTRLGAAMLSLLRVGIVAIIILMAGRIASRQFLRFPLQDIVFMASTILVFLLVVWRIEIGIALVVATTSFIVYHGVFPTLSPYYFLPELKVLESWNLQVGQGIILLLLGVLVLRGRADLRPKLASPLSLAVAFFMVAILCASTFGVVFNDVNFPTMVAEARQFSYYFMFFLVFLGLRDRDDIKRLLIILLAMSVFVAICMILQFVSGDRFRFFLGSTRVEIVGRFAGRVLPPGHELVWLSIPMVVACSSIITGRLRGFFVAILSVLAGGLILTFTRAEWLGAIVGLLAMIWVGRSERRGIVRTLTGFIATIGFFLLVLAAVSTGAQNYADVYVQRFLSSFDPTAYAEGSTFEQRLIEIRAAWEEIAKHPWFGIGVGNAYRYELKWDDAEQTEVLRGIRYIHNAYFFVFCKAGGVGLVALLTMLGVFFTRAIRSMRWLTSPLDRAIVLGSIGTTVACCVGSLLQPSLTRLSAATVLVIAWGCTELILWFHQAETTAPPWTRFRTQHLANDPVFMHDIRAPKRW